ncbi:exodeoxyribonuclease VII small subunit [Gammaproteobacteria bacterium]|nr:exodeoxyribonuclease VII small subunit [Gammaproteobacteria bacterium]
MAEVKISQFEKKFSDLEQLVKSIDDQKYSLAESLKAYKQGMQWIDECQKMLNQAELTIKQYQAQQTQPQQDE